MSYKTITYEVDGPIAFLSLNRPERYNTIVSPMHFEMENALGRACADRDVKVIVLQGNGDSFCAGFDFADDLDHFDEWGIDVGDQWDPGRDMMAVTDPFNGPVPKFMGIWRCPKPVITKIHGWCVGGGSEMGLLGDIVIAADDAQIGTPYSRVWGAHLTGMWIYRLGLAKAKQYALTGEPVSGKEAARIELINESCPREELDDRVRYWAEKLANIPSTQLATMKLMVNQAYDNMGLQSTQTLGVILDGSMRNTPEGKEFVDVAMKHGVKEAVTRRDGPFGDYSQAPADRRPGKG